MNEANYRAFLAARVNKCILLCEELSRIDPYESPISRETTWLSTLCGTVKASADAGNIRLHTALRLIDTILTLQEECCIERKAQLERSARS